MMSIFMLSRQR